MPSIRKNSNVGSTDRPNLGVLAESDRALLAQFQMRYPTGSLTAELLQIHQENFVVRAVIQVAGVTLATGLAAADSLEVAEDFARRRALAVLGLYPPAGVEAVVLSPLPTAPIQPPQAFTTELRSAEPTFATSTHYAPLVDYGDHSALAQEEMPTVPALGSLALASDNGVKSSPFNSFDLPVYDEPEPDEPIEESLYDEYVPDEYVPDEYKPDDIEKPIEEPIEKLIVPEVPPPPTPASPTRTKRSKVVPAQTEAAEPAPQPASAKAPIDLSDAIAQTTIEIKRLKWTEVQGRSYLQRTYGKRSRQHLSDEELFEFLDYLQQQPSPNEF